MKNLTLALCILVVGCFSTNDSRKPASNKPSDILKLADGGSRDEDTSQDAAIEPDPVESNDASTIDSGTVEKIDAATVDASMVDAGTDASSNIGYTDAGLAYVNDGDQCDDCIDKTDCAEGYTCDNIDAFHTYHRCLLIWTPTERCPLPSTIEEAKCRPGKDEGATFQKVYYTCDEWRKLTGDYN